jgi:hypothetical protein
MFVKSFLTGKRGEGSNGIEDNIAVDMSSGRFAVSDGVSQSFLPQVWSGILTQAWITVDNIDNFPQENLYEQFHQEKDRIMEFLDEDTRMDYEDLETKYKTASATFCGVELQEGLLRWVVIGDSCLFILPDGEHPQCISSHPMPTDDEGKITPYFDNTPFQVLANGKVYGEWVRGEREFEKGTLLLMSDAMSAWFINAHNEGHTPLEQLMALTDDESFEQWVDEQYRLGLLNSDDESVVIVQLDYVEENEHTTSPDPHLDDEVKEQTNNTKNSVARKKRHGLRIAAFLRLCRMKCRNMQIKQNGSELQTE